MFDYIYGVLHAPNYRETFAEFLKIDFPRIPYPPSPAVFAHVSVKGEQLRRLHLMEPAAVGDTPYSYHGDGDDVVASGYPKYLPSPLQGRGRDAEGGEGEGQSSASPTAPLLPSLRSGTRSGSTAPRAVEGVPGAQPTRNAPEGEREGGRVHINPTQHFANVPAVAGGFPIGGYLPAQKWLKDRRGRALSWDDIGHYQKIIKILTETDRIMREIAMPLDS